MSEPDDCPICDFVALASKAAWIYDDDAWVAGVLPGLEVPGWFVLSLRRHATEATGMNSTEAQSLGPLIVQLTRAIQSAAEAQRVYIQSYGEHAAHFHVLLASRGADVPPEHRHAAFWAHRFEYIEPAAAYAVAAATRRVLQAQLPALPPRG